MVIPLELHFLQIGWMFQCYTQVIHMLLNLEMFFFMHMILMDSENQIAMNLEKRTLLQIKVMKG